MNQDQSFGYPIVGFKLQPGTDVGIVMTYSPSVFGLITWKESFRLVLDEDADGKLRWVNQPADAEFRSAVARVPPQSLCAMQSDTTSHVPQPFGRRPLPYHCSEIISVPTPKA